jgi:hypothetical protein
VLSDTVENKRVLMRVDFDIKDVGRWQCDLSILVEFAKSRPSYILSVETAYGRFKNKRIRRSIRCIGAKGRDGRALAEALTRPGALKSG